MPNPFPLTIDGINYAMPWNKPQPPTQADFQNYRNAIRSTPQHNQAAFLAPLKSNQGFTLKDVVDYTNRYLTPGSGSTPNILLHKMIGLPPGERYNLLPEKLSALGKYTLMRRAYEQAGTGSGRISPAPPQAPPNLLQQGAQIVGDVLSYPSSLVKSALQPLEFAGENALVRGGWGYENRAPSDIAEQNRVAHLPFFKRAQILQHQDLRALAQPQHAAELQTLYENSSPASKFIESFGGNIANMSIDPLTVLTAGSDAWLAGVPGLSKAVSAGFLGSQALPFLAHPENIHRDPASFAAVVPFLLMGGSHLLGSGSAYQPATPSETANVRIPDFIRALLSNTTRETPPASAGQRVSSPGRLSPQSAGADLQVRSGAAERPTAAPLSSVLSKVRNEASQGQRAATSAPPQNGPSRALLQRLIPSLFGNDANASEATSATPQNLLNLSSGASVPGGRSAIGVSAPRPSAVPRLSPQVPGEMPSTAIPYKTGTVGRRPAVGILGNSALQNDTKGISYDTNENGGVPKGPSDLSIPGNASGTWTPKIQPAGKLVSHALDTSQLFGSPEVHQTINTIDSLHGDGNLPNIPMYLSMLQRQAGRYNPNPPYDITIGSQHPHMELTTAHEIGHFLDQWGMVPDGVYSSHSDPIMQGWRDAVQNSKAYKGLENLQRNRYQTVSLSNGTSIQLPVDLARLRYYLAPDELWARSYAQYIAQHSGDATLLQQLQDRMQKVPGQVNYPRQWQFNDFQPISDEMDIMFRNLGWIR